MIAHLRGVLAVKELAGLVVDVGGVGYSVVVSGSTFARLPAEGDPVTLHVHTHTHERGQELFGFHSVEERRVFRLLLGVSGVGPRVAVSILSAMEAVDLVQAVVRDDIAALTAVPGIGRKTAQRLCVELRDPLAKLAQAWQALSPAAAAGQPPGTGARPGDLQAVLDVRSALCNMGYKVAKVEAVLPEIRKRAADGAALDELLRHGLRLLRPASK